MLIGFVFLYILYRRMSNYLKSAPRQDAPNFITFDDKSEPTVSPQMLEMKNEQINRLKELANLEPARVASVIKTWVGK